LRAVLLAVLVAGSILYLWLLSRSWVGRDQMILLELGQRFALTGKLDAVAKGMSGGGMIPGSLLQLLIGLPLLLWQDYRAPLIPIAIFTFAAGIFVYRVALREAGLEYAAVFFILYWLSPWRVYHAAVLWEPAFLFLPAALHFWCASKLKAEKKGLPSFLLGLVLFATPQLHGSFLFLWLLSALLLYRKEIRIHWPGFGLGAALASLTFIPLLLAAFAGTLPSSLPKEGFIGKGFVTVWPMLKGVLYWIRLGSLDIGDPLKEIIYFQTGWAATTLDKILVIALRVLQIIAPLTIAMVLWSLWWFYKERRRTWAVVGITWLERYTLYAAIALVLSAGFSPITLQGWHVIITLHAALIPVAIWMIERAKKIRRTKVLFGAYLGIVVIILIVIGLGKGTFRKDALPKEIVSMPIVRPILPANLPIEQ
jgi:hypothetical protein